MVTTSPPADPAAALRGTPVVPGLAYAPVVLVAQEVSPAAIEAYGDGGHAGPDDAMAAYDAAAEAVAEGFAAKAERASGAATEVLTASAGLTRDKGLRQAVAGRVAGGQDLLASVHDGVAQFVDVFTAMGGLMAERATDLLDIERRLVARLVGEPEPGVTAPEGPSVLVAHDLAPADTAGLDPAVVAALVTERGGATSHTAIIARQLAIPCVVGVAGCLDLRAGTNVLVDGAAGTVATGVDPDEATQRVQDDRAARALADSWTGPGQTADGTHVTILANVADGESARSAAKAPVEGVGLFRTELCFLDRRDEPSAEEQATIYAEVLEPFAGIDDGHVVVRTLDAGSDKPIAFATLEVEENPALGVRGLRLAFHNPGLLERQLDGIAGAASQHRRRHLGDGADGGHGGRGRRFRRAGPQPWAQGRDHGRGAERGPARRSDAGGRRLPLDRDQRPDAVRHGRGPARHRPRSPDRPLATGGAAHGRDHRRGRPPGAQAGRRVRGGRR